MATNRIQHFSVSSDFTSQSGAIAANDNANVALQKLQGSKIDLVTSPVANDILFTDVNGQAIDSGISAQTSGTLVNSATSIPTGNVIKAAIDAASQGLAIKNPSQVGTVTALPACTIDGTFQILTADANGALPSIDGYSSLAVGNQITVKEESGANAVNNGIYIITQLGDATTPFILTRSIQANTWDELVGAYTFILNGATLQGDGWVCNIASGGTLGTTDITFVQFNEGTAYTAGAGINIASNVISVANGGTGIATTTAYSVLFSGTTSTGAFQATAGPGTATHVLTSNGAGALPTFQAPSGITAGKAIALAMIFGF